ncbi:AMP-binding protein [Streptomyces sp. NPDC091287]|uniref:AMP-binding protein n=1 Tax=Streptomyces sp. NPDC091287 TaxID=3365988 RepID=UPI0037FBB252
MRHMCERSRGARGLRTSGGQRGRSPRAGRLRTAVSGGAALPVEVSKQFDEAFGVGVQEGYGLSETSPVACFNPPGFPPRTGSIGRPVWGVEMRLVDDAWRTVPGDGPGEIAIRGHNVRQDPQARTHRGGRELRRPALAGCTNSAVGDCRDCAETTGVRSPRMCGQTPM